MWSEKYRPCKLSQIAGQPQVTKPLQTLLETARKHRSQMPHLLFLGPPGCGKTSTAHIVAEELHADKKELNASLYRTIDTVRTEVASFVRYLPLNSSGRKVLIMDELDGLWSDAQLAMNRLMEQSTHTSFILACNDEDKLVSTVKSRCVPFRFKPVKTEEIIRTLAHILRKEGCRYRKANLAKIAKIADGDLRRAVNMAEGYWKTLNSYGQKPLWAFWVIK